MESSAELAQLKTMVRSFYSLFCPVSDGKLKLPIDCYEFVLNPKLWMKDAVRLGASKGLLDKIRVLIAAREIYTRKDVQLEERFDIVTVKYWLNEIEARDALLITSISTLYKRNIEI